MILFKKKIVLYVCKSVYILSCFQDFFGFLIGIVNSKNITRKKISFHTKHIVIKTFISNYGLQMDPFLFVFS